MGKRVTMKPSAGVFRDSIRVRSSSSGSQYVRPIDILLSDKAADKMSHVNRVFRSSQSGRFVAVTTPASPKKK